MSAKKKRLVREWQCSNCDEWNEDDGSGDNYYGWTCTDCGAVMYPITEGDEMTWRYTEESE